MLYIFHGTDIPSSVNKANSLVNSLRTKRPDSSFVKIESDKWNPAVVQENIGGQGLFSSKYIIFLDRVTENADAKENLPSFMANMKESENIFIILEGKVNTELKKSFDKYAEKIVVSDEKEAVGSFKKKDFNIFALADAVGSRDSFKAWKIYREAVDTGIESESILGTLFWQVKSMLLASAGKTAGETGLNPFVFSKSKKHAGNYSEVELQNLLGKIITLYHDGHRGVNDLEFGTEILCAQLDSNQRPTP